MDKLEIEEVVVIVRLALYNRGLPCGACAIGRELQNMGLIPPPSRSAINRILKRRCLTNGRTGYYAEDMGIFL